MTSDMHDGGLDAPTPEEVGAAYDEFGPLYGLTLGESAIHIGMWTPHGEREPASTLPDLANRAMDRQTDAYIDALPVGPGDHFLDIGCGTGGPAVRLARRTGARVTGVTVSKSQIAHSEERARAAALTDRVSFAYGNAMELAYEDGSFDAAWAIDSFPHLSDRLAGLREACRVLRPGATMLLTEFTRRGDPPPEQVATFREVWTSPPPMTPAEGLELTARAGFELVRLENHSQNVAVSGELMAVLYQDRHDEVLRRYGPEATARMDAAMPLLRTFVRDHLGYYVYLLRKP
ncbi:class I SAM-dependent methyltransferase [Streptomyces armeniacus]|uniref:Class I SAM-dependent methyltransferase n=1 Tax=Streptomyces armeniacus TaxID=83291 RepID=A0A345XWT8_9ACTN|nr:methyltransferase domain-containing protein [Streptomyces armeniacus]AXK36104.1 class I SAM-dependent methyltransferase [Streptomyces armeniacus]